jgi:hypothetical protein
MTVAFEDSRVAAGILEAIRAAVTEGVEAKSLQAMPHTVLISDNFYHARIKPLLSKWMGLFLAASGVNSHSTATGDRASGEVSHIISSLCFGCPHFLYSSITY